MKQTHVLSGPNNERCACAARVSHKREILEGDDGVTLADTNAQVILTFMHQGFHIWPLIYITAARRPLACKCMIQQNVGCERDGSNLHALVQQR